MDPEKILDASSASETNDSNRDASEADSSTASEDVNPLEVEMVALGFSDNTEDSSPSGEDEQDEANASEDDAESEDGDTTADASEETDEDTPFHTHPRFQKVIRERNEARDKAGRFDQFIDYMKGKSLSEDDLDSALALAAALKNPNAENAEEQLKALSPFMQKLQARTGQGDLPDDLAEEVTAGMISEERARQIVRDQAELNAVSERQRIETETAQRQAAEQAQVQAAQAMMQSVSVEEAKWRSESNFEQKLPLIKEQMQQIFQDIGRPSTPEGAVRMAQIAKAHVDALPQFKTVSKPAVSTLTGSQPKTQRPEPKTPKEAAMRELGF
jgi:hypothetical protein